MPAAAERPRSRSSYAASCAHPPPPWPLLPRSQKALASSPLLTVASSHPAGTSMRQAKIRHLPLLLPCLDVWRGNRWAVASMCEDWRR
uniref:Uncharacterized protein n=1 Tax=Arundo donax TaxID=35708 RepID=A0A0A9EL37_ARUDO